MRAAERAADACCIDKRGKIMDKKIAEPERPESINVVESVERMPTDK